MKLQLDVPWWLVLNLRGHLEDEVATLHEQCISQADLYRAERQRQMLALVIGQLDTHLEAKAHEFNQVMAEAHRRETENCDEDSDES